jgi:uncharacterized protein YecE (DUF72 family)
VTLLTITPSIRIGCCGLLRARRVYFAHFALLEVQQTFYKPPAVATARRWREEAPPGFIFTLKAWQLITHEPSSPTYRKAGLTIAEADRERYGAFRPTEEVYDAWARTLGIARALEARVVVFQCPASFTHTEEHVANLHAFFGQVERGGLLFAWEPRGPWPDELVRELCRELDLIHCVDPFQQPSVHGVPAYFRLHGRTGYRYRYTDEDLLQLRAWCEQYPEVYCLFNNVSMWEAASRFRQLVEASAERVP